MKVGDKVRPIHFPTMIGTITQIDGRNITVKFDGDDNNGENWYVEELEKVCASCGRSYNLCKCDFGPTISQEEFERILGNTKMEDIEEAIKQDWIDNPPNPLSIRELANIIANEDDPNKIAATVKCWLMDFYGESVYPEDDEHKVKIFEIPDNLLE